MATISKTLSKDEVNGKKQILIRVYLSKQQRPRLKSNVFINPYYFKNGEIIIPRKSKRSPEEDQEAIFAKQELENYIEKVFAIISCAERNFQEANGSWIKEAIEAESLGYVKVKNGKCSLKDLHNVMLPPSITTINAKGKQARYGQKKTLYSYFEHYCTARNISLKRKSSYLLLGRAIFRYEQYMKIVEKIDNYFFNFDTVTINEINDFKEFFRNEHVIKQKFPDAYAQIEQNQKECFPMRHTHSTDYNYAIRSENYIVNILKKMRAVFRWLNEDLRITKNDPFKGMSIGVEKETAHPVFITIEERNKLADLEIEDKELGIQRDIFIFQCLIGCRFSDLITLTPDNIFNGVLEYLPGKTRHQVRPPQPRIPLGKRALELVKKYENVDTKGRLFPFRSIGTYNSAIKEAFKLAGITRKVFVLDPKIGEEVLVPINEVASSHMARRTFVGNAYKIVKDPSIISSMSGHAPYSRSFARYRDIDDDMRKEIIDKIN